MKDTTSVSALGLLSDHRALPFFARDWVASLLLIINRPKPAGRQDELLEMKSYYSTSPQQFFSPGFAGSGINHFENMQPIKGRRPPRDPRS